MKKYLFIVLSLITGKIFANIVEVKQDKLDSYLLSCNIQNISSSSYAGKYDESYKKRCQNKNLSWFDGYVDHLINQNRLVQIAKTYSDKAALIDFGKTNRNKNMLALKITDFKTGEEKLKTPVLINCAHHALELLSTEFCYQIISELLHTKSDVISKYVFYIIPIVNPDGSENYWQRTIYSGRKNGKKTTPGPWTGKDGVDLNRNYPFKWGQVSRTTSDNPASAYFMGTEAASEPEVQAMMALANKIRFTLSLTFHTAATKVLTPYTIPGAVNPHPNIPIKFANIISKKAKTARENKPRYIVAKNLYPVSGTDQDWHYHQNGTIALLVEGPFFHRNITYKKSREVVRGFLPGFYYFLHQYEISPKIRVFVTDKNNNPLSVSISLDEFSFYEGEDWKTDKQNGKFIFLLEQKGTYNLTIQHQGKSIKKKVQATDLLNEVYIQLD